MQTTISMRDFFNMPEVKELQEIQKSNPYGSAKHRKASDDMKAIAETYGAQAFFGEY